MELILQRALSRLMPLLLATALPVALSGCKMKEFVAQAVGRYEGIAFITTDGVTQQRFANGDVVESEKNSLGLTLRSLEDHRAWDFDLQVKDKNTVVISSRSGWIDALKFTRASSDCFAARKDSDLNQDPRACFDGHELVISVNLKSSKNSVTFLLNRAEARTRPQMETPAVFSLDDLRNRAKSRSFETRVEFERVVQARLGAQLALLNLLPHFNINTVLRIASLNALTAARSVGEVAPFLLPNRWYHMATEKFKSRAEFWAWATMRADSALIAEGLAYSMARDTRQIQRLEDEANTVTQIRDQIRDREHSGLIQVGSSDDITSVLNSVMEARATLAQNLKDESTGLAQAVGFFNPEAVTDVSGVPIQPVEGLSKETQDLASEVALARSLELRQMDELIESAKSAVGERVFNWLDPTGDPSGSLGLGFPAYVKIAKTEVAALRIKREQLQSLVLKRVSDAVTLANQSAYAYKLSLSEAEVEQRRIERLTQNIRAGINFVLSDLVNALTAQAQNDVVQVQAEYMYYTALANIQRLTFAGAYSDIPREQNHVAAPNAGRPE